MGMTLSPSLSFSNPMSYMHYVLKQTITRPQYFNKLTHNTQTNPKANTTPKRAAIPSMVAI